MPAATVTKPRSTRSKSLSSLIATELDGHNILLPLQDKAPTIPVAEPTDGVYSMDSITPSLGAAAPLVVMVVAFLAVGTATYFVARINWAIAAKLGHQIALFADRQLGGQKVDFRVYAPIFDAP
jgi:hypothetical protein